MYKYLIAIGAVILSLSSIPVMAQSGSASDPKLIGTFDQWSAYSFRENGDKVCFMASQPTSEEGDYTQRGDVFSLITHRPGEDSVNVVSFVAGYTFKQGGEVTVTANGKEFPLFTDGDTAWTPTDAMDKRLTDAIRAGQTMVVKGTSSRGTLTNDTYSLDGSAAAYRAISRACNVTVN
jgi:hypothetical protein